MWRIFKWVINLYSGSCQFDFLVVYVIFSRCGGFLKTVVCILSDLFGVGVQGGSEIRSNANLGVRGQGHLQLQGAGDAIIAQRLFVSLFFNVIVRQSSHRPP